MSNRILPERASRAGRLKSSLSLVTDRKLLSYTAAASAAGIGMLTMAQPSQAEVVYTPTNQLIKLNTTLSLDLNNDGVTDFFIDNIYEVCTETGGRLECSGFTVQLLDVIPAALNGVAAGPRVTPALPAGQKVGPGDNFAAFGSMENCSTNVGRGPYSAVHGATRKTDIWPCQSRSMDRRITVGLV
jgi:hypothetical protein